MTKAGSDCKLLSNITEVEEEKQEATVSPAAAEETCVDAALLSELGGIFRLREEPRTVPKDFILTGFGKSFGKQLPGSTGIKKMSPLTSHILFWKGLPFPKVESF